MRLAKTNKLMKTKILQKIFLSLITLVFVSFGLSPRTSAADHNHELVSTIAFMSSRDDPSSPFPVVDPGETYLMDPDGTNLRRLTENMVGDFFAALSPDEKKIVFDSTSLRLSTEPRNTSDLFLMETDGTEQTWLTRGSSATWSPDSKNITFHASASARGCPPRPIPALRPAIATSSSRMLTTFWRVWPGRRTLPTVPTQLTTTRNGRPMAQRSRSRVTPQRTLIPVIRVMPRFT